MSFTSPPIPTVMQKAKTFLWKTSNSSIPNLQQTPNSTKFPVGCKIWYNAKNSRAPTKLLRAKSASVVGVYMHFEKMQKVYKVRSDAQSQYDVFLYEDRLVYGMICPVTVGNTYTNDTRDGVIVCPKLDAGNDWKQQIAYNVQITQGSNVTIEFGVAAERIKYRMEDSVKKVCVDNTTKGEKEEGSDVDGLEAKESKVEEVEEGNGVKEVKTKEKKVNYEEAKELSKGHSISTNSNNVEVSALKPGAQQLESSALPPAPSAGSAFKAKVAKAAAGNIAADDYAKLSDMEVVHDTSQKTTKWNDHEKTTSGVKVESIEHKTKECGERNDQELDIARWEPPATSLQRKRSSGSEAILEAANSEKAEDALELVHNDEKVTPPVLKGVIQKEMKPLKDEVKRVSHLGNTLAGLSKTQKRNRQKRAAKKRKRTPEAEADANGDNNDDDDTSTAQTGERKKSKSKNSDSNPETAQSVTQKKTQKKAKRNADKNERGTSRRGMRDEKQAASSTPMRRKGKDSKQRSR